MNAQKTLTTRIKGGLGNQLFIYASSFGLAKKFNRRLIVDATSGYVSDPYGRVYLLDRFNISANTCSDDPYRGLYGRAKRFLSSRICEYLPHKLRWYLLDNIETHFHNSTFANYHSLYLDGYLQSDEYFKDYRQELLQEFDITAPIAPEVRALANVIESDPSSVIVGVRRFKEVANGPHVPTLDEGFYEKCFQIMQSQLNSPKFFIVTEDEEWARAKLNFSKDIIFVPHIADNERAHENLYLMSKASNFILANSTYHWWGAWLSLSSTKKIISPKHGWIHPKPCPDGWIEV